MNTVQEINLTELGFQMLFEGKYADAYVNPEKKIIACILKEDYVPIKYFKETFNQLSETIRKGGFEKFIFDKRSLRTFHQPSMEWYFIEWKTEMLSYGVKTHRKILPNLDWFVKAVEIAKRPLLSKIPMELSSQLDIQYCDSLEEAVNK